MRDPTKDPLFEEPPERWSPKNFLCNYAEPNECGCLKVKPKREMVEDTGYEHQGQAYGLCQECYALGIKEAEDQKINRRGAIEHSRMQRDLP
jgi:hypothetical protein